MTARSMMKMRTTVLTKENTPDPWGGEGEDVWNPTRANMPCHVRSESRMEVVGPVAETVNKQIRMLCMHKLSERNNRIGDVTDRQGRVLFEGPFDIESVEYKYDHYACLLTRAK